MHICLAGIMAVSIDMASAHPFEHRHLSVDVQALFLSSMYLFVSLSNTFMCSVLSIPQRSGDTTVGIFPVLQCRALYSMVAPFHLY